MALPSAAEMEDDRQSVASASTSIWGGIDDPLINVLRSSRKAVNVLRRRLTTEYARVKSLDVKDFKDDFPDVDELRYTFGKEILRHINLARQTAAETPTNAEFVLSKVANSVAVFKEVWDKTAYFGKATAYPRIDIPTTAEIIRPIVDHAAGDKRPRAELSLSTTMMEAGGAVGVPHASSPLDPEDIDVVETAVAGDDGFLRPNVPARQRRPATPTGSASDGLASLQALQRDSGAQAEFLATPGAPRSVEQWVAQATAAATSGSERMGSAHNPVIVGSPNMAQRLISEQQAQLEEMKRQMVATEASLRHQYDVALEK